MNEGTRNELTAALYRSRGPDRELDKRLHGLTPRPGLPVPRYTESIEAAISLIPDEYVWQMNSYGRVLLTHRDDHYRTILENAYRSVTTSICLAAVRAIDAVETKRQRQEITLPESKNDETTNNLKTFRVTSLEEGDAEKHVVEVETMTGAESKPTGTDNG